MSRVMLLVVLLMIFVVTTQWEWRQLFLGDLDANPMYSQNQKQFSKGEEGVKEKIILSQEKKMRRLSELVWSLKEQLKQCQRFNVTSNITITPSMENAIELENEQSIND